ncbi:MAG: hypothetical protein ACTSRK_00785 [Promethearchaeota archaeon]
MKSLSEEIQEILTPHNSLSFIKKNRIHQLHPLLSLNKFIELGDQVSGPLKKKLLNLLQSENILIYNGTIFSSSKGLNFKGRLKEILTVYHQHLKKVVGDKKALIDLYEKIPANDISNLTENHVIFVMKSEVRTKEKSLAAIRFVPPYEIHFENLVYQMPACTIAIRIDSNLHLGNPEVISDGTDAFYEHPFVYRDRYDFGQKICMGSFYNSEDQKVFNRLRFANNINSLIRQAVQILITGYNRRVNPANGHLGTSQYSKYLKKKSMEIE